MKTIPSLLLAAFLLGACNETTHSNDNLAQTDSSFSLSQVKQTIETKNNQFANAMVKGDSATVVGLYHSDAKVFPPNMGAGNKNAMGSMAVSMANMGVKTFALHTTDVLGNADMVVETGTYEMGDGSKTIDNGKYMVVWKEENGDWKLWRDMWNSDNAPAAMK